jgi:hypothetical protein
MGFGECKGVARTGVVPGLETGFLISVGVFQLQQPVQRLIHGRIAEDIIGGRLRALRA